MQKYRLINSLGIGFFGLYLALAILGSFSSKGEIFPFFNWVLFPTIPNEVVVYELQILQHQGKIYPDPVKGKALQDIIQYPHSINYYTAVQKLGRASSTSNEQQKQNALNIIRSQFLSPPFTLQLLQKKHNPIKTWNGEAADVILMETIHLSK